MFILWAQIYLLMYYLIDAPITIVFVSWMYVHIFYCMLFVLYKNTNPLDQSPIKAIYIGKAWPPG